MRLIPGFNPLTQKDANGKECRGIVELPFCKGYCKTSEVIFYLLFISNFNFQSGTHGFPPRVQMSKVCTLVKTSDRKVVLDDCDEGASEDIKFVLVPHGTQCECSAVPLEQAHS